MDIQAEKVNPYIHDRRDKGQQVRDMFDNIAPAYDFMNRAMTFGIDKIWRNVAVKEIVRRRPSAVLDVATGTGDLAILLAKKMPEANITAVDLSEGMLSIGREKVDKAGLSDRISLSVADCLDLPFGDDMFDLITVAYGVRNFQNLLDGYKEMYRVLKPGGMISVIVLSTPTAPLAKAGYDVYTKFIIPSVGRLVSKDTRAYSYLPESIAAVPQRSEMTRLMEMSGFKHAKYRTLTFGVCSIYTAVK